MNDLDKVAFKLNALEKLVLAQQEAIKAIAEELIVVAQLSGKLATILEESAVQDLKAKLDASEKCGKHCACGDHNG